MYILPGWSILTWLLPKHSISLSVQLCLSMGICLALYPILLLGSYVLDLQLGPLLAWGPGILGGLSLIWRYVSYRISDAKELNSERETSLPSDGWFLLHPIITPANLVLALAIVTLVITRIIPLQEMSAPAWGDSVHHTMIAQLIVENGGLFQSWQPYAPIQTYTYHFGLHTLVALWIWITDTTAPQAMLIVGQILNVLAVLSLYPLTMRLSKRFSHANNGENTKGNRHQWAGIGAIVIAAFLSPMPAFYLNWGRYTQLAGQIILPTLLYFFDLWWFEKRRTEPRLLAIILLLATGLVLTHYRIAFLGATAGLAWGLWGLWVYRQQWRAWWIRVGGLASLILVAVGLILPWIIIVRQGQLPAIFGAVAQLSTQDAGIQSEIQIWSNLAEYYPIWLWGSALLILFISIFLQPRLAFLLIAWSFFSFAITNPYLLWLPGTGWITNFLLVLGLYIPIALLGGWFIGQLWERFSSISTQTVAWAGRLSIITAIFIGVGWGATKQIEIVDPTFQMVTEADLEVFEWIRENTPPNAYFLVNGFLVYNGWAVAGSDAGWWLPLYTKRASTVPPILYVTEQTNQFVDKQKLRQITEDVGLSEGNSIKLRAAFCRHEIGYLFLGQKQGSVGFGVSPLIDPEWLIQHNDFTLLYQKEQAQVWQFHLDTC